MRRGRFGLMALAPVLLAAASLAAQHEARGSYTFSGSAAGVGQIVIDAAEGQVVVSAWDRGEFRIQALKKVIAPEPAKASRARRAVERIEVEVSRRGDEVAVTVAYPGACRDDLECGVEFKLLVPAEIEVVTRSGSG